MPRRTFIILLVCKLAAIGLAVAAITLPDRRLWTEAAILFFGADLWVLYHLFVPSAQGLCRSFTHFATTRPEVWLTIDDGPDLVDTPLILDLLDRFEAKATFFVIGERAALHPELLTEIKLRGHDIGHHTHTHPALTFWCASQDRVHRELDLSLAVFRAAGLRPRWFRPPVGIKNFLLPAALAERKLSCVGWTIRSGDCFTRQPERVAARVLRHLRPGAIVLMHEGPGVPAAVRVRAIGLALEGLTAEGYRCVLPKPEQLR